MTEAAVQIPGYVAGTWTIDPVHSEVSFVVRHMMVSKVRGRFDKFEGTIITAPDPLQDLARPAACRFAGYPRLTGRPRIARRPRRVPGRP